MRISTSQVFLNNIDALSRANSDLFKTQQQIATGKNILQPSDDPLASAQVIKLKNEVARTDQFQSNIEVSNRRLSLEEITLDQLFNDSVRLKELTIQAGNGALSDADRATLATEVDEITNQMLGLMNTKDVQGEYLFSGYKGNTQAYVYDQANEEYRFQGDSGQRFIQVGPDNQIASTDSGMTLFERVQGVVVPVVSDDPESVIAANYLTDFETFEQAMAGGTTFEINVDDTGLLRVTASAGFDVFSGDDPPVNLTQDGVSVESGDRVSFSGVEMVVGSIPGSGQGPYAATLEGSIERNNVLNVALELRNGLTSIDTSTDEGKLALDELLGKTLVALEGVQETNLRARGSLGARMNALEQQELVNDDYQLFTREALSSIEDLDYNEAISRFSLQQTVLQAAYSSFSQIQDLSLFNYIR